MTLKLVPNIKNRLLSKPRHTDTPDPSALLVSAPTRPRAFWSPNSWTNDLRARPGASVSASTASVCRSRGSIFLVAASWPALAAVWFGPRRRACFLRTLWVPLRDARSSLVPLCVCVCVCVHVCMYVCMHVSMHVCHVCNVMYICMYVCIIYIYIHIYIYICARALIRCKYRGKNLCVCLYVCVCVCVCVCLCITRRVDVEKWICVCYVCVCVCSCARAWVRACVLKRENVKKKISVRVCVLEREREGSDARRSSCRFSHVSCEMVCMHTWLFKMVHSETCVLRSSCAFM